MRWGRAKLNLFAIKMWVSVVAISNPVVLMSLPSRFSGSWVVLVSGWGWAVVRVGFLVRAEVRMNWNLGSVLVGVWVGR